MSLVSVPSRLRARGSAIALGLLVSAGLTFSGCSREQTPPAPTAAADKAGTPGATKAPAPGTPGAPATGTADKAGAAIAARRANEAEKDKARQAAAEQVPVETAAIVRGPISAFLSFNSTLETESAVDIYPQTGGQVESLLVEEGRIVKEGDPLLKIEDRELRVDVEESTANFQHLEKNFGRSEDLFERNLVNKQDHETQKYQVEQARLRLERAKIRLAYATVRAPFAGVISAREAQVGARVGTGTKLFSMVKLDDIVARVFVPGRYLPIVKVDQSAVVTSEFLPDRTFKGWVKRISPVIDPKSGTFKVTVGVRGEKPTDLPPGLFVGVRVVTDTRPDAVLIPKRAVIYEGGERYVFVVANGRAAKKKLAIGYEDPTNVEATTGFEIGTQVIVLGQAGLKDGSMVRSVTATAADTAKTAAPAPAAKNSKS
ncbi:MAG: efflux RND transporter periplasmic adaptor subunit [Verrucomicrobiota bacterium]